MNPFRYNLQEMSKALVALIGVIGFAVLYLANTGWSPALIPAVQTLGLAVLSVVAVFLAKNHSPDDLSKALLGAITAGVAVYSYFGHVGGNTVEVLGIVAGYITTFVGVFWAHNAAPITGGSAAPPSVTGG